MKPFTLVKLCKTILAIEGEHNKWDPKKELFFTSRAERNFHLTKQRGMRKPSKQPNLVQVFSSIIMVHKTGVLKLIVVYMFDSVWPDM